MRPARRAIPGDALYARSSWQDRRPRRLRQKHRGLGRVGLRDDAMSCPACV